MQFARVFVWVENMCLLMGTGMIIIQVLYMKFLENPKACFPHLQRWRNMVSVCFSRLVLKAKLIIIPASLFFPPVDTFKQFALETLMRSVATYKAQIKLVNQIFPPPTPKLCRHLERAFEAVRRPGQKIPKNVVITSSNKNHYKEH